MKTLKTLFVIMITAAAIEAQPKLVSQKITLKNDRSFSLKVAEGYEVIPAAEGLKRVRFFARSPDGRIFVTDMYNLTDNSRGAIYILDEWNGQAGRFGKVTAYITGLRNPNSVAFYRDADGQDWLYIAETYKLTRRKFTPGETKPTDTGPQTVATFPDYGLSYKYGGWHLTRTLAFGTNGKLYVSVGSSCNSCVEKEKVRASVIEMDPDGTNVREIASGLRNAVGLRWIDGRLWASNQGSDHLGLERPDETFYMLYDSRAPGPGSIDHGWPYCHSAGGKLFADPELRRPTGCRYVVAPFAYFPAHSSALGFDRFEGPTAPEELRDAFVLALHGSTNKTVGSGYKTVAFREGRRPVDVISGFLRGTTILGRPCDIMKLSEGSFLFSDDYSGIVYYVRRKA